LGLNVIGLEISENMIKRANINKLNIGSKAEIIKGSYFNVPLENNSVDYVLFPKNIVECSYEEFEIVCNEANRILKNNGKFIITINEDIKEHSKYDLLYGYNETELNIPNKKCEIKYRTYFWTIGFANSIIEKYFKNEYIENIIDDKKSTYLLIYRKV
jgi:ubiquinone/menaquinone biosynthesis C-methylase UbiE